MIMPWFFFPIHLSVFFSSELVELYIHLFVVVWWQTTSWQKKVVGVRGSQRRGVKDKVVQIPLSKEACTVKFPGPALHLAPHHERRWAGKCGASEEERVTSPRLCQVWLTLSQRLSDLVLKALWEVWLLKSRIFLNDRPSCWYHFIQ